MEDRLATYLKDHMAGAEFAMSLLQRLQEAHADEPLGGFAAELLRQIESDFEVLQSIAGKLDVGSHPIRQGAAWLAEKAGQIKLRCTKDNPLGTFEALEFLALGVYGKLKLWQVLSVLASHRSELQDIDYAKLTVRAEAQHDELELRRREVARLTFLNNAAQADGK
jgi:hypothetical protein